MKLTNVFIGVIVAIAIVWYLVARMFRRPKPVAARSVYASNETFRPTPTSSRRTRATSPAQTTGVYDTSDGDEVGLDIDISNSPARSGHQKSLHWPVDHKDHDHHHDRADTNHVGGGSSDSDGDGGD